jgi:hypothetical protein
MRHGPVQLDIAMAAHRVSAQDGRARWGWSAILGGVTSPIFGVRPLRALVLGACFGLAVLVRLIGIDVTVTADEGFWMQRTLRFGAALEQGDLRGTFRIGHPGVTVMWTGLAGIGRDQARAFAANRYTRYYVLEQASAYGVTFAAARLAVTLVATGLVTLAIGLAWRLLGGGAALLGGGLLLFDPFVVGMTRLLHVDALLGPLMTVAALATLAYWYDGGRRRDLVVSAVATGLALLTKPPALLIGPLFAALGLAATVRLPSRRRSAAASLLLWGGLVGLTFVAGWPAMWVDPRGTLAGVTRFILEEGARPHPGGVFFLGQSLAHDPGPTFYPIAFLLRLGPLPTIGLVCLLLLRSSARRLPAAIALVGYVLLFVVAMSFGAKKLDRYLLPALMVADLVAGVGLWALVRQAGRAMPAVMAGCLAVQLGWFVAAQPYPIAAYNALVGGTETARRLITVGWGEGLDQAAAFLNARRRADHLVIASNYPHVVRPRFRGTTHSLTRLPPQVTHVDYVVVYISTAQRDNFSPWARRVIEAAPPVFVARVHGMGYAWVFRVPTGLERPSPSDEDRDDDDADEDG